MRTDIDHTPGPWEVIADHDISVSGEWDEDGALTVSGFTAIKGGDGELAIIVIDMNNVNQWNDPLLDANTALIKAAPNMLAALKALMPTGIDISNVNTADDFVVPLDVTMGELRKLAAAIALATVSA